MPTQLHHRFSLMDLLMAAAAFGTKLAITLSNHLTGHARVRQSEMWPSSRAASRRRQVPAHPRWRATPFWRAGARERRAARRARIDVRRARKVRARRAAQASKPGAAT